LIDSFLLVFNKIRNEGRIIKEPSSLSIIDDPLDVDEKPNQEMLEDADDQQHESSVANIEDEAQKNRKKLLEDIFGDSDSEDENVPEFVDKEAEDLEETGKNRLMDLIRRKDKQKKKKGIVKIVTLLVKKVVVQEKNDLVKMMMLVVRKKSADLKVEKKGAHQWNYQVNPAIMIKLILNVLVKLQVHLYLWMMEMNLEWP